MAKYSYQDFERALAESGMTGNFGDADMKLAMRDPDAGMSLLNFKKDYGAAQTDEARALAHMGAENIRSTYGNYSGGADGSKFYMGGLRPSSFDPGAAPTYQNGYAGDIKDLYEQLKDYGEYSYEGGPAPEWESRHDETIQKLLGELINREDFSYDPETDPLYSQYRKQYSREGQRATQDALGAAAAASGGIPSSYAAMAATQAGDYYAAQMTDKIPELYQLALNTYMNDYNMDLTNLGAVQGAEQSDYDKFLNQLNQYNTDRAFDYNAWMDQYNMIQNSLNNAQGLEQSDYTKFLNDRQQWNLDREFGYGQVLDEINAQAAERDAALNKALTAAEFGDFSGLQSMGINTDRNPMDWQREYELAQLAAQFGDFSGLQKLGVDPDAAGLAKFNQTASGKSGGSSGGSYSGSGSYSSGGTDATGQGGQTGALSGDDIQALRGYYGSMELTDAQWSEIMKNNPGITDAMLQAAGFSKKKTGSGKEPNGDYGLDDLDTVSVLQLGIGPINYNTVEKLVEEGKVEAYTDARGKLSVRWANGYNAKNYNKGSGGTGLLGMLPLPGVR